MGVGRLTLPRTVESAYKANVEPPQFWTGETTNRKNSGRRNFWRWLLKDYFHFHERPMPNYEAAC